MKFGTVLVAWVGTALALLLSPVPHAAGATLTFTDPNCADFQLTDQGGGNFAVTCNFLTVPVCQLTASSLNPTVGSTITLNAACSGNPVGWLFTGTANGCGTSQSTCTDSQANAGAITYTVVGGNAAGRGPVASVTVNWQAGAALTAPSGCALTANPATLPTGGGATTLSVACSGGGAPTSFAWTGGTLATSTSTSSQSVNITATTAFSVTPSNSAGSGNTATATVTVSGTTSGSLDYCSQYSQVSVIDVPWGGQATSGGSAGSFFRAGILVARFTVPPSFQSSASGNRGGVTFGEWIDAPTFRQASLSTKACDFRGVATTSTTGLATSKYTWSVTGGGTSYPLLWVAGNSGTAQFTVTGTALGVPQLVPGTTYYLNLRNYSPYLNGGAGGISCATTTCNVIIQVATPQ